MANVRIFVFDDVYLKETKAKTTTESRTNNEWMKRTRESNTRY